jgi:hypothetical protein
LSGAKSCPNRVVLQLMSTKSDGSPELVHLKFSICVLENCPPLVPGRLKKPGLCGTIFIAMSRDVLNGRSRPTEVPAKAARTSAAADNTTSERRMVGGSFRLGEYERTGARRDTANAQGR